MNIEKILEFKTIHNEKLLDYDGVLKFFKKIFSISPFFIHRKQLQNKIVKEDFIFAFDFGIIVTMKGLLFISVKGVIEIDFLEINKISVNTQNLKVTFGVYEINYISITSEIPKLFILFQNIFEFANGKTFYQNIESNLIENQSNLEIEKKIFKYLYKNDEGYHFLNEESYEQISLPESIIEKSINLFPNQEIYINFNSNTNKPISIDTNQFHKSNYKINENQLISHLREKWGEINNKYYPEKDYNEKTTGFNLFLLYKELKNVFGEEIIHCKEKTLANLNFTEYSIDNKNQINSCLNLTSDKRNIHDNFDFNEIFPNDFSNYFWSKSLINNHPYIRKENIVFSILGSIYFTSNEIIICSNSDTSDRVTASTRDDKITRLVYICMKFEEEIDESFKRKIFARDNDFGFNNLSIVTYKQIEEIILKGINGIFKSDFPIKIIVDKNNDTSIFTNFAISNFKTHLVLNLEGCHDTSKPPSFKTNISCCFNVNNYYKTSEYDNSYYHIHENKLIRHIKFNTFPDTIDNRGSIMIKNIWTEKYFDLYKLADILNLYFTQNGIQKFISKNYKLLSSSLNYSSKITLSQLLFEANKHKFESTEFQKITRFLSFVLNQKKNFYLIKTKINCNSLDEFIKADIKLITLYLLEFKKFKLFETLFAKIITYKREDKQLNFYLLYNKIEDLGIFSNEFEKKLISKIGNLEQILTKINFNLSNINFLLKDLSDELISINSILDTMSLDLSQIDNDLKDIFLDM